MAARFCGAKQVFTFVGPGQLSDPETVRGPFHGFAGMTDSGPRWTERVELIESALEIPLHWRKPRRIFVNSMSDLFHEALPDEAIDLVFAIMALCPQHQFIVLTKRAERMVRWFKELTSERMVDGIWAAPTVRGYSGGWPLPNVWLGVSVENRKALHRVDLLRKTPAALRFISAEPLLEDLGDVDLTGIGWVICGGETGPGARPMHPDWVRSLRDQCVVSGVAFHFKQWGAWQNGSDDHCDGSIVLNDGTVYPVDMDGVSRIHKYNWGHFDPVMMARVGKASAGRLLDGREWNEVPR
jgi:protein gp37